MKFLLVAAAALMAVAYTAPAFAAGSGGAVPFSLYSATSATAVKSSAYKTRGFKTKTVTVQGVAIATHEDAALSGTVLVECAPSSAGPWSTCVDNGYAQTAVSTTANGTRTWTDASAYVRASWAKTAGLVKVWLDWVE
jgi:hypothetical protein